MDRREVEERLEAIEARRRDAAERMVRSRQRLEHLEEERDELLGEKALAQQTLADLEEYEVRLQAELTQARLEEARAELTAATRARDALVGRASQSVGAVVSALRELDAARDAVADGRARLRALDPSAPIDVPAEPAPFGSHLREAAELVERELNRPLESDLVEAAARSPQVAAIDQLPGHLQELARQRKRALVGRGGDRTRRNA